MNLRGIEVGPVFTGSGARNFFPEPGWWWHPLLHQFVPGFDFTGTTFIAKTTTLAPKADNMSLRKNLQPRELFPGCIKLYPAKGIILNAVGLSGPGAQALLDFNIWQQMQTPFVLSFMAVKETPAERLEEIKQFIDLLEEQLSFFATKIILEINISCPNTLHNPSDLIKEAINQLRIASRLGAPLIIKLNALATIEEVREISALGLCDAIECSNTIPWGQLPDQIDWMGLFGTKISPLAKYSKNGGGLSGWPLMPIVIDWIKIVRDTGITIPILAGGGIGCKGWFGGCEQEILILKKAGANGIVIGTVVLLRPWKVEEIIRFANQVFKKYK